ncbi:hypothetical protein [Argonema antarcticum]|uniref:hypothetical protein n=1 Tax=Argonema antarcticum TaxID=2942763 RepID=UPI002012D813|nr:hypothetical protein [Argonema antarcticum]MCL1475896.1 hypothetical protein [Argonema antarcticum A004/B2]
MLLYILSQLAHFWQGKTPFYLCDRNLVYMLEMSIGGKRYREFVIEQLLSIPEKLYTTRAPLAGLGIGYQMQWLKQKAPKYKHLQLALF